MNRGKTALKRGVAVASVAAMAIAGAVLAAPAASAWDATHGAALGDIVRATPAVDDAAGYAADGTGAVPTLAAGASNQAASGVQLQLPIATSGTTQYATWRAGEQLTVTLPSGVTFAEAPTVTVSPLSDLSELAKKAGHAGAGATAATQLYSNQNLNSTNQVAKLVAPTFTSALSSGSGTLTLTIKANPWGNTDVHAGDQTFATAPAFFTDSALTTAAPGTAQPGYVVSLDGVKLNVASNYSGPAITASVGGASWNGSTIATDPSVGGVTTVGFVPNSATISVASGSLVSGGGAQAIPDITVKELTPAAFGSAVSVVVNAPAGVALDPAAPAPTVKVLRDGTIATTAVATATKVTVTFTGDNTKDDSFVIQGLRTTAVTATSDVNFTVTLPTPYTAINKNAAGATSTFSFTPNVTSVPSNAVSVTGAILGHRVAGVDRYETSRLLVNDFGGFSSLVVANGEQYKLGVDALAANYLAGKVGGPILLVSANAVSAQALKTIADGFGGTLGKIYVMGGTDSVSAAVATQLAGATNAASGQNTIIRVAGADRYGTAADAATWDLAWTPASFSFTYLKPTLRTAFLASGQNNADAIAAGAVSYMAGIPMLLTTSGSTLPAATVNALKALHIQQVIILGGPDRVSTAVEKGLASQGILNVKRIAGSDRYATAADLYDFVYTPKPTSTVTAGGLGVAGGNTVYLANGLTGWPDALSAGPIAGDNNDALLTVAPNMLPDSTSAFLTGSHATTFQSNGANTTALGQPATIAQSVLNDAVTALG